MLFSLYVYLLTDIRHFCSIHFNLSQCSLHFILFTQHERHAFYRYGHGHYRSGLSVRVTGLACFIAVPIWQQWASKG